VTEAVLVASPSDLDSAVREFKMLTSVYSYDVGNRYAEYKEGDKLAEYGLAALIAGGAGAAIVKSGAGKMDLQGSDPRRLSRSGGFVGQAEVQALPQQELMGKISHYYFFHRASGGHRGVGAIFSECGTVTSR
jgi:hypothetical protein